jgi:hypothetical protein
VFSGVFIVMQSELVQRVRLSAARVRPEQIGAQIELLPPHASSRRYARVPGQGVRPSEVVMLMPPPGAPADEGGVVAKPLPVSNDPFVVCQRWLSGLGIRVPGILALDDEGDCMWLEDCGHEDFDQWLQRTRTPHVEGYQLPLGVLAQLQTMSQQRPVPALVASRVFDRPMLAWELEHYMEWRLQVQLGLSLPERARQAGHGLPRRCQIRGEGQVQRRPDPAPQLCLHRLAGQGQQIDPLHHPRAERGAKPEARRGAEQRPHRRDGGSQPGR